MNFDLLDFPELQVPPQPTHACAGEHCQVCQNSRTPLEAKTLGTGRPKRDPRWWDEARQFITQLGSGATFTADDLVALIGLPDGSSAQVGACVRAWAAGDQIVHNGYTTSTRKSNHGRVVRVWRKS